MEQRQPTGLRFESAERSNLQGAGSWAYSRPTVEIRGVTRGTARVDRDDAAPGLDISTWHALRADGYTYGLTEEILKDEERTLFRHWIIDNSGSMLAYDGHVLRGSQKDTHVITTTRWAELQATLAYHAQLAGVLRSTSFFNLINATGDPRVPRQFSVAAGEISNIPQEVERAKKAILLCQPQGPSPITVLLTEVRDRIAMSTDILRDTGQKAVIILATDGLPTGRTGTFSPESAKKFVQVLTSMKDLPVWVVVRLCTDDEEVCKFYNQLDYELELPLEVIDDYIQESSEVAIHNPWLNYSLPLHRIRERGCQVRLFDLLDERPLNKDEMRQLLTIIFGKAQLENAPNVHDDWKGFINAITPVVKKHGTVWNPRTKKMEPWLDVKKLERAFHYRGSGFLRHLMK